MTTYTMLQNVTVLLCQPIDSINGNSCHTCVVLVASEAYMHLIDLVQHQSAIQDSRMFIVSGSAKM